MKNLNICIDIDGTITDAYYWLEPCNKYFNTNIRQEEVTEYNIHHILNIPEEKYIEFYEGNKYKMHWEQEIRQDAIKYINKLSKLHNIYFVTARDESLTMLTRSYLKKHNIPYDELFLLGSHYKVYMAEKLDCSVFIEDNYHNAIQLSHAGFKVLLLDTNYNRLPLDDNITRVYDWKDVYEIIDELLLQYNAM